MPEAPAPSFDKSAAKAALRDARAAWDAEDWPAAGAAYARFHAIVPAERHRPENLFDHALAYKFARDWPNALAVGRLAAAAVPRGEGEAAYWNLGIAATILEEWDTARDAWRGFGIDLPDGEGPIDDGFGPTCVRIDVPDGQEVVWALRLCPTRARVVNVPLSPARRWGEIVVHDGVPNGERFLGEHSVPVFDELLPAVPGPYPTLSAQVTAEEGGTRSLTELFDSRGYCAEPTGNVRMLCEACSTGSVRHDQEGGHDCDGPEVDGGSGAAEQRVLLAAPPEVAEELLAEWAGGDPERTHTRPEPYAG